MEKAHKLFVDAPVITPPSRHRRLARQNLPQRSRQAGLEKVTNHASRIRLMLSLTLYCDSRHSHAPRRWV